MIVCGRSKQHLKAVETLRAELEEEEQALDGSDDSVAASLPAAECDTDDVAMDVDVEPPQKLHDSEIDTDEGAEADESEQHAAGHLQPPPPMCKHLTSLMNAFCDLSSHNRTFCALCLTRND